MSVNIIFIFQDSSVAVSYCSVMFHVEGIIIDKKIVITFLQIYLFVVKIGWKN